ncbi:MAG: EamA family transporter [Fusobacterium necrophorum]|nr:EamA family transporter [Fusobacterium necrophorum]
MLQSKTKYTVYMFLVTLFWGLTYGLTKVCLEYSSELHIISFRFFLSFITSFFVLRKKILPIQAKDLRYSFILSILLFFVFLTMTVGLKHTTASNAGFLVSLSVIFIPFGETMLKTNFYRNKKSRKILGMQSTQFSDLFTFMELGII